MAESPSNFSQWAQWTQPDYEQWQSGWQQDYQPPRHDPSTRVFVFSDQTWPQLPPPPDYNWLL